MTDLVKLGVLVSGKLGHRHVELNDLLPGLSALEMHFQGAKIVFSCDGELDQGQKSLFSSRGWTYLYCEDDFSTRGSGPQRSIAIQTYQVTRGLEVFDPNHTDVVIRLRTDWVIRDPAALARVIREYYESRLPIGCAVITASIGPLLPMPYFIEDLVTIGTLRSLSVFWHPWTSADEYFDKKCRFFDKSLFLSLGQPRLTVEQLLWFRFFFDRAPQISDLKVSPANLLKSWNLSNSVYKFSPSNAGLLAPSHIRSPKFFARIFYWPTLENVAHGARPFVVYLTWLLYSLLFFTHPHWVAQRLKYLGQRWPFRRGVRR